MHMIVTRRRGDGDNNRAAANRSSVMPTTMAMPTEKIITAPRPKPPAVLPAARPREDGPRAGTQGNQQPQTRHRERLGTGPAPQLLMQL